VKCNELENAKRVKTVGTTGLVAELYLERVIRKKLDDRADFSDSETKLRNVRNEGYRVEKADLLRNRSATSRTSASSFALWLRKTSQGKASAMSRVGLGGLLSASPPARSQVWNVINSRPGGTLHFSADAPRRAKGASRLLAGVSAGAVIVPQGRPRIAQQFTAGGIIRRKRVPQGRQN